MNGKTYITIFFKNECSITGLASSQEKVLFREESKDPESEFLLKEVKKIQGFILLGSSWKQ